MNEQTDWRFVYEPYLVKVLGLHQILFSVIAMIWRQNLWCFEIVNKITIKKKHFWTQNQVYLTVWENPSNNMEDIFHWIRKGDAIKVRMWLDDTEHDMNQGYAYSCNVEILLFPLIKSSIIQTMKFVSHCLLIISGTTINFLLYIGLQKAATQKLLKCWWVVELEFIRQIWETILHCIWLPRLEIGILSWW